MTNTPADMKKEDGGAMRVDQKARDAAWKEWLRDADKRTYYARLDSAITAYADALLKSRSE